MVAVPFWDVGVYRHGQTHTEQSSGKFVITFSSFCGVNDTQLLTAITAKVLVPSFTEIPLYNLFRAWRLDVIILPEIIKWHQISPQAIIEKWSTRACWNSDAVFGLWRSIPWCHIIRIYLKLSSEIALLHKKTFRAQDMVLLDRPAVKKQKLYPASKKRIANNLFVRCFSSPPCFPSLIFFTGWLTHWITACVGEQRINASCLQKSLG